jgi:hypothetical protein
MIRNIVIAHEQVQIVNVVLSLQLSIYIPQVLAGKLDGIPMAFFTAIVPDFGRIARTRFDRNQH